VRIYYRVIDTHDYFEHNKANNYQQTVDNAHVQQLIFGQPSLKNKEALI